MSKFWMENVSILFDKGSIFKIIPEKDDDINTKLNAIFRFSIYYSMLSYVIYKNNSIFCFPFIVMLIKIYIYKTNGGGGDEDKRIPAQFVCLLDISTLKIPVGGWLGDDGKPDFADGYPVRTNGQYAVVRKFKSAAETTSSNKNEPTNIVWSGSIDNKLYLYPCDSINREIAVVQNTDIAGKTSDKFFVVRNRNDWLYHFQNQILIR